MSVDKATTVLIMQPEVHGKDDLSAAILSQAQVASAAMAVASLTESQGSVYGQNVLLQSPTDSSMHVSRGFLTSAMRAGNITGAAKGGSVQVVQLSKEDFAQRCAVRDGREWVFSSGPSAPALPPPS